MLSTFNSAREALSQRFSLPHNISKHIRTAGKELRLALPTKRVFPDFLLLCSKSDKDHYLDSFILFYFTLRFCHGNGRYTVHVCFKNVFFLRFSPFLFYL